MRRSRHGTFVFVPRMASHYLQSTRLASCRASLTQTSENEQSDRWGRRLYFSMFLIPVDQSCERLLSTEREDPPNYRNDTNRDSQNDKGHVETCPAMLARRAVTANEAAPLVINPAEARDGTRGIALIGAGLRARVKEERRDRLGATSNHENASTTTTGTARGGKPFSRGVILHT